MSDNIRLAAQELFNIHVQPTSKQILVAVVLDSVREAMFKKSSSSFTLADAENFLGRENVESAPLFKDYVASIEELGSYVKNIDVSGFFSTDDQGHLHTYLDLSHSCVQNFYYVGMSPSWQDIAELLVIVRKTLTEEFKPITKEVMELVIGWMIKFMNSISRCLPADGWDDFLSRHPPPSPPSRSPSNGSPSHKSPSHESPSHESPSHEAPSHKSLSNESPSHNSHSHKSPSHESPSHESPSHESPSHKSPSHESPSHESLSHESPSHKSASHESPSHESPSHESPSHKSPSHKSHTHESPSHESPSHESPLHESPAKESSNMETDSQPAEELTHTKSSGKRKVDEDLAAEPSEANNTGQMPGETDMSQRVINDIIGQAGPTTSTGSSDTAPDGCMPLVGCSCGAVGGPRYVLNSKSLEYYKNMSTCTVCRKYQCLHCGDDFRTRNLCQHHILRTKSHKENTAIVTTEHSNRPLSTKTSAPQLDDDIALVPCGGQCPGTEGDAFKVHQYMSKCRICQQYKCAICMKKSKPRRVLETHITDDHGFDFHQDIVESAILQHKKAADLFMEKVGKPQQDSISFVPDGAKPLVGCSCGAPGGPECYKHPYTKIYYTNMSRCKVCMRFQCLMCGDEFATLLTCQTHISDEKTHQDGTAVVTTEYPNRPLPAPYTPAPPLSHQIKLLPCVDDCPGTVNDAFKLHQYMSKCRICRKYKCALCLYKSTYRNALDKHITGKHELDFLKPVEPRAIKENHNINVNDIVLKNIEGLISGPPVQTANKTQSRNKTQTTDEEIKPLVGCSCGAANGPKHVINTVSKKPYKNVSFCGACKRYQCLDCGDEFPTLIKCVLHVSKDRSHRDGTVCVTTEHSNRPLPPPSSLAPPLSDQIVSLPCVDDCPGKSNDAFKVNQYMSKCRLCEGYKCSICTYKSKHKGMVANHLRTTHKVDYMKPVEESILSSRKEKEERKPLVGCSCGAPGGPAYLPKTASHKHQKNMSFCGVCKRYQCLHCGDEFPTLRSCTNHAARDKSHLDGKVCVTTEHTNRPLPQPFSLAPPLSDKIVPLPCADDCRGKSNDAFKLNQYMSKCRLCEGYKCSICPNKSKNKTMVSQHIVQGHKLDYMKPVDDSAIKENIEIRIPSFR